MKSVKIPKRVIGKVNRRRTDNTMEKKGKPWSTAININAYAVS